MLDALLAGVIVDEAGALVRDFDARTIGCRRRRAATGGTAYRLHRKMETRHRRALPRSGEPTSEIQSLMPPAYACFSLITTKKNHRSEQHSGGYDVSRERTDNTI